MIETPSSPALDSQQAPEQVIQVAADDDVTSIKARLEFSGARRVLMVVPGKNKTLNNLVNLKMLARTADRLNIQVGLVLKSGRARELAKAAGLKAFASEWLANRLGFIGQAAPRVDPERSAPPQLRLLEEPTPPRVRIKDRKLVLVVGRGRVDLAQQVVALVLVGLLALLLVMVAVVVAPRATVTLIPAVEEISTELIVTADPDPNVTAVDEEDNIIPARAVQVEITRFEEVETIDTEAAPVDYATGRVVFFNRTQDEQLIPISTTLRTSSGVPIEFRTTQTATIPAGTGATTSTTIIAVEPGPVGNVATGQINRFSNPTQGLLARVINELPTAGGSVRQAGIVTEDDKDRVRSKLRQLIQQQGFEMLVAELDEQEYIPPESLQVIELDLTYNRFSGDVAETLGAEMRAVVRATAVGSYYANQLAYFSLLEQVPPGTELLSEGLRFSAGGVQAVDNRAVTFPVIGEGIAVHQIDPETVRRKIAFMPIGRAQAWMAGQLPIVSVPGADVAPDWLGRMPLIPWRIDVVVQDVRPLIFGEGE